ncbi:MAG: VOC family protein [Candidatus Moraniibacteriota bacterium]|jgi:predicted enzyme related to lactoylglutathione lyase
MKLDSAVFYSNNLNVTIPFYRDVLGLDVNYIQENRFASFNFENGKIGIKQKKEDREIPGHQTVFVEVDNIEEVYKKFQERGIIFLKKLTREDWAINFSLLDPDKNKIQFISNQI